MAWTRTRTASWVLAASMGLGMASGALAADAYTATSIPPIAGGTGTIGYGVNNAGMVVGQANDSAGNLVAFVYENGTSTALPSLTGSTDAAAYSVNTSGVIVGYCRDASNVQRAVKWERVNGTWTITDLGTLDAGNGGFGVAQRVNDAGDVIGYSSIGVPGPYHACVWSIGAPTRDLGTLDYTGPLAYSQGLGINNAGWVTGYAYRVLGGPEHGMSIAPGARAEDVTPQESFGLAQWHNVTDNGELIGYISGSSTTQGAFRPAIYVGGQGYTLIPQIAGTPEGYGYDMNNSGVAVGTMFLLAPVPDPNLFLGFKYERGATSDLNTITTGLPGVFTEARDVSDTGLIVGTADVGGQSQAVLLSPVSECAADFNGADGLTVQDIFDFLNAWFASDVQADFNGADGVTVQDIFDFLNAWFAGC